MGIVKKNWGKLKGHHDQIVAVTAVFNLFFAGGLVWFGLQTRDLQLAVVRLEEASHESELLPVGFTLCSVIDGSGNTRTFGMLDLINKGWHGTGILSIAPLGMQADGKVGFLDF